MTDTQILVYYFAADIATTAKAAYDASVDRRDMLEMLREVAGNSPANAGPVQPIPGAPPAPQQTVHPTATDISNQKSNPPSQAVSSPVSTDKINEIAGRADK